MSLRCKAVLKPFFKSFDCVKKNSLLPVLRRSSWWRLQADQSTSRRSCLLHLGQYQLSRNVRCRNLMVADRNVRQQRQLLFCLNCRDIVDAIVVEFSVFDDFVVFFLRKRKRECVESNSIYISSTTYIQRGNERKQSKHKSQQQQFHLSLRRESSSSSSPWRQSSSPRRDDVKMEEQRR